MVSGYAGTMTPGSVVPGRLVPGGGMTEALREAPIGRLQGTAKGVRDRNGALAGFVERLEQFANHLSGPPPADNSVDAPTPACEPTCAIDELADALREQGRLFARLERVVSRLN